MARSLAPPLSLLQLGLVACLFFPLSLPAQTDQQSSNLPRYPSPNASAQELEDQGDMLRAEKRYLDSVDFYKAAIAKKPSALLWNKEGMAYLLLQR